jgi:Zn-dependent protease with chaperone function
LAGFLLIVAAVRTVRYRRRVRRERAPFVAVDGLEVVTTDEPIAFAVPGRPGGVVIGSELLRCLAREERAAVLAHEHAHLRHHHHRYVHTAELCAAAFPFLTPLARDVRFATERWADESAAAEIGSRRTLAKAIARVALMGGGSHRQVAMAFTGRGATARVDALLHPSEQRQWQIPAAVAAVMLATILVGSSVQLHHLAAFVMHICRL